MARKLEEIEAKKFAKWLSIRGYKFSHIGNESGQSGTRNIIAMMAKKKAMGVSPGFPDYCVILKRGSLLFIELKKCRNRMKNGEFYALSSDGIDIKPHQIGWINDLNEIDNVSATFAYGCDDAKEQIEYYENL